MVERDGKSTNNYKIYLGPAQRGRKRKRNFARDSLLASRWGKEKVCFSVLNLNLYTPRSGWGTFYFSSLNRDLRPPSIPPPQFPPAEAHPHYIPAAPADVISPHRLELAGPGTPCIFLSAK